MISNTYPWPTLKHLPLRERPVYRVSHDVDSCNLAELLAAVIGGSQQIEIAHALLATFENLGNLVRASTQELEAIAGLGTAGAARLKAALELGRRMLLDVPEDRLIVRSVTDAASLLIPEMAHLEQEHFRVLYLDTRNRLLDSETLYVGSLNATHIRVGEVFRGAIKRNCAAIIVAHNHPSTDPAPSPDDLEVTRQLIAAGDLVGIDVLDHLIIGGHQRFVSLHEQGLGGPWP
jgi:DNA repair protein RadC